MYYHYNTFSFDLTRDAQQKRSPRLRPLLEWLHDIGPTACPLIPRLHTSVTSLTMEDAIMLSLITGDHRTSGLLENRITIFILGCNMQQSRAIQRLAREAFAVGRVARSHSWTVEVAWMLNFISVDMRPASAKGRRAMVRQAILSSIPVLIVETMAAIFPWFYAVG